MKYFITGYKGQLGYDIAKKLIADGEYDIVISDRTEFNEEVDTKSIKLKNENNLEFIPLDITNEKEVEDLITKVKPDVIFHCAAWTNVDGAEDNYEACYKVNVDGTKNLTEAARKVDAKIVYISSDYVFDGKKEGLYIEEDKTNPLNSYGKTKFLGEEEARKYNKHFILRISWVYGVNGRNFVKTMLNLSETKTELNVVCDQIGSPTYTKDVANLLVNMIKTDKYGTYHGTNEEYCSWAEFAREIFKVNNCNVVVHDTKSIDYKTKAERPLNSKLSKQKLQNNGFDLLPTWKDALQRYCEELVEYNEPEGKIIIKNRK